MKILVFGASGFIGNACYTYFQNENGVIGIDVNNSNNAKILVDTNFSKSKNLIKNNNFDIIVNCAGSSNIQQSFLKPELDYDLNTRFVEKILMAIKESSPDTKLINLSSAAVYGNPKSLPIKETDPTAPLSPYGKNKLLSENLIESYAKTHNTQGISIRIFSAYGAGLKRQFFYDLSEKFHNNPKNILLQGTGKESRDFIYITDIMLAIDCLINHANFDGEVYNLANGEEVFIEELAKKYVDIFNYKGKIEFTNKQFEGYPINWKADISKIKSLGYKPIISLEQGMRFYSDWIKIHFKS